MAQMKKTNRIKESRTHVPQPIPSSLRQVVTISDDDSDKSSSDELATQHRPFLSWPTGRDNPGLPSASRLPSPPSPLPQIPIPAPNFVELAISSPAGQFRMLLDKDSEPLPYYAVLKGERPGVYYGREAARRGGGASEGQVWCSVISEEQANRMFVTMYMKGEVSRI